MSQQDSDITQEEQDLNRTRQVRSDIITEMTKEGIKVDDPEKVKLLLTVLTDTDRSALSRMKLKSDDKNNANNAGAAAVIAEFLNKVTVNNGGFNGMSAGQIPTLPDTVPVPKLAPGETDIGVTNTNFESFSKAHFKPVE